MNISPELSTEVQCSAGHKKSRLKSVVGCAGTGAVKDHPSESFTIFVAGTNQRAVSLRMYSYPLENEMSRANDFSEVTREDTLERVYAQLRRRHLAVASHRLQQFFVYPPVSLAPLPWSLCLHAAGVISGSTLHLRTRILGGVRSHNAGKMSFQMCACFYC